MVCEMRVLDRLSAGQMLFANLHKFSFFIHALYIVFTTLVKCFTIKSKTKNDELEIYADLGHSEVIF